MRSEPDLNKLAVSADVDSFLICAENMQHLPLLEEALPAGKPVMCETPLVPPLPTLRKSRPLHAKLPAPLFCGHFLSFSGEMLAIAQLMAEGSFGKINTGTLP